MTVAVLTDSASDLSPAVAGPRHIRIVPLIVTFGDSSFRDGEDLDPRGFWARVGTGPFPTTASPSPADLERAYRDAAAEGAGGVVSIHLSGSLSRTVQTAASASSGAPVPVEVVDSASVSLGQALVALAAADAAAAGATVGATAEAARDAAGRVEVYAMLDGVDFLRRGGRLGATKAALSELLRIRPVLTIVAGETTLVAKARTRGRAIDDMLARVDGPAEAIGIMDAEAPEADAVAATVRERTGLEPLRATIGAVTGTHLGPRSLGVAVLRPPGRGRSGTPG